MGHHLQDTLKPMILALGGDLGLGGTAVESWIEANPLNVRLICALGDGLELESGRRVFQWKEL
jgi:isopenicillin N synthase-like dioxygenase